MVHNPRHLGRVSNWLFQAALWLADVLTVFPHWMRAPSSHNQFENPPHWLGGLFWAVWFYNERPSEVVELLKKPLSRSQSVKRRVRDDNASLTSRQFRDSFAFRCCFAVFIFSVTARISKMIVVLIKIVLAFEFIEVCRTDFRRSSGNTKYVTISNFNNKCDKNPWIKPNVPRQSPFYGTEFQVRRRKWV